MRAVNLKDQVPRIIDRTKDEYLTIQKQQLMEGKDSSGGDLKPGYLEDPFFKTPKAAAAYLRWKQHITPNPKRNPNAPNLFITGVFHGSLNVTVGGGFIKTSSSSSIFGSVERKYSGKELGLSPVSKGRYSKDYVMPKVREYVHEITELK